MSCHLYSAFTLGRLVVTRRATSIQPSGTLHLVSLWAAPWDTTRAARSLHLRGCHVDTIRAMGCHSAFSVVCGHASCHLYSAFTLGRLVVTCRATCIQPSGTLPCFSFSWRSDGGTRLVTLAGCLHTRLSCGHIACHRDSTYTRGRLVVTLRATCIQP